MTDTPQAEIEQLRVRLAEAQAEAQKSDALLHAILDNLPVGVWLIAKDGTILRTNPAGERIWGGARYLKMGEYGQYKGWWTDSGRPIEAQEWGAARAIMRGETSFNEVIDIEAFDGARKTILHSAVPVRDAQGQIAGAVVVNQEITAVRQAEAESARQLREALIETVRAIAATIEKRDPFVSGHQQAVAELGQALAREMGLPEECAQGLYMAGLIHDIGTIAVPAEILGRPGRLSQVEFGLIRVHPEVGYGIVKGIGFPWPIAETILQHQERLDGSGYPRGLKEGEMILEAKILAVANVVEAMCSHRPYRPAPGIDAALEEIGRGRGALYDAAVVDACLRLFKEKGFQFASKQEAEPVLSVTALGAMGIGNAASY